MATPYRVTAQFWDHATLWGDDESMAGHTTDGGRVFGITRTRYVECDHYGCKPVAVIDPEDREQVARLAKAHADLSSGFAELMDEPWTMPAMRMRQALREFANPKPPKPDEPTGLGAVVEDADGNRWVRTYLRYGTGWVTGDEGTGHEPWSAIDAVRVLSEGVQS